MIGASYRSAFISCSVCGSPMTRTIAPFGERYVCDRADEHGPNYGPAWDPHAPLARPQGFLEAPLRPRPA